MAKPIVGVTVLPEYFQFEGVDQVLDNLVERAGVTAVATSPYVMELADEQTGSREPPIDAGAGKVRLLDRPLWGKRELWVRTAPSFEPERRLYEGLRYQPPETSPLTAKGGVIEQVIEGAHRRGLAVYFQVQAAIPPGYRVQFGGPAEEDLPRMPDGSAPKNRVANNASLASPEVIAYQRALIRDLHRAYPAIDGIRFDWPEYPPYRLDSMFVDFSAHARAFAERCGMSDNDYQMARDDSASFYQWIHGGLTNDDLEHFQQDRESLSSRVREAFPGVLKALELKAQLSTNLLRELRAAMDEVSEGRWLLAPSAFPPPWSIISGMSFRQSSKLCDAFSVKLYGMHWAMMLRFYGEQLLAANETLDERLLTRALAALLQIADDDGLDSLDAYHYPEPQEPHPVGERAQVNKIQWAQCQAGETPIHVLAHGYGPADDVARRIQIARKASEHGFWVNRYGYLSDEKLDAIGGQ